MFGGVAGAIMSGGGQLGPAGQLVVDYYNNKKAREHASDIRNADIAYQREFAQHGIRWRVEDAKAAGIHPLYALGAQGASYQPVGSMDDGRGFDASASLEKAGQGMQRMMQATRTQEEQEIAKLQIANAKADLDGKVIDNQIRASTLRNLNTPQTAFPGSTNFIPGQASSGLVVEKPKERTVSEPGRPAQEAGWVPDVGFSRTDTGLTPVVPESLSESLEDDIIGKALWRVRNQVLSNFGQGSPPKSMLPEGYSHWAWNFSKQEWQPKRKYDGHRFGPPKNNNWGLHRWFTGDY